MFTIPGKYLGALFYFSGYAYAEKGEPLQIIYFRGKEVNGEIFHKLKINDVNLLKVASHRDLKDRPVEIVSVAGAFRVGKSFLTGFLMKYLEKTV